MATTPDPTFTTKPRWITLICTFIAIILVHLLFLPEFRQIKHDPVFISFDVVLVLVSIILQILALHNIADPNKDWQFTVGIVVFAVAFIWAGGWLSDYRSEAKQGIQYHYTVTKGDSTKTKAP